MIWVVTAIALIAWLTAIILRIGPLANILLLSAAVLLAYQVIQERGRRPPRDS